MVPRCSWFFLLHRPKFVLLYKCFQDGNRGVRQSLHGLIARFGRPTDNERSIFARRKSSPGFSKRLLQFIRWKMSELGWQLLQIFQENKLGSLSFVLFMDRKGRTRNNCKDDDGLIWMGCVAVGSRPSVLMPIGEEIQLRWLLPSIDFQIPGQSPWRKAIQGLRIRCC
ncbi:uncharacterized protein LOC110416154 [Herrania umbratica]|uniref:Uncharacterized protein LOC110416154 n=1 Tax=Herrania umbratica TaxID=108875 RepID=A0A6J1AA89_9ROSI|nr:uncharacterized protein LOC110416154 [Herrania umbratica]